MTKPKLTLVYSASELEIALREYERREAWIVRMGPYTPKHIKPFKRPSWIKKAVWDRALFQRQFERELHKVKIRKCEEELARRASDGNAACQAHCHDLGIKYICLTSDAPSAA